MLRDSKNTPLIQKKKLCDRLELPNLWIKDESKNSFGTYKDRRSRFIIKEAITHKVKKLVLITSGNAGYSLAKFAKNNNIQVTCVVGKNCKKSIKDNLRKDSKVIEVDLYQKRLQSKEILTLAYPSYKETIWDVTNGFEEAYGTIIKEIKQEKPDFIIVPVGSGEAFVGLYQGIKKAKLKIKIIGVRPQKKQDSFADKLCTLWTPYETKIRAIQKEGHRIIELKEELIKKLYTKYKSQLKLEPSASIVFGAFEKLKFKKEDKIILINSGKGLL